VAINLLQEDPFLEKDKNKKLKEKIKNKFDNLQI